MERNVPQPLNLSVDETGVGEMGGGETGKIKGETGVGETGVGEMGVIRSVVVLLVSFHLCQFELRLNHFAFVNILCFFIAMIPMGLRESLTLAPYTSSCILYICNIGYCSRKLTVSPNKNIIMSSFKSSRDIQKKEGGPDSCFG